ncbi:hypothetical protein D3C85_962720 [compost metagenome]
MSMTSAAVASRSVPAAGATMEPAASTARRSLASCPGLPTPPLLALTRKKSLMVSTPLAPLPPVGSVMFSAPYMKKSRPAPPMRVSLPVSPQRISLPAPPLIWSLPPRPRMMLSMLSNTVAPTALTVLLLPVRVSSCWEPFRFSMLRSRSRPKPPPATVTKVLFAGTAPSTTPLLSTKADMSMMTPELASLASKASIPTLPR